MKKNQVYSLLFLLLFCAQLKAQDWTRQLDGPYVPSLTWTGSQFNGLDVQQTSDGNYVMTGVLSFLTGAIRDYPCMVKVNAQGFTIWEKSYFSDNADVYGALDLSMVEMPNGNLLLASLNYGNNISLIQTNALGDTVWTQFLAVVNNPNPGNAQQIDLEATSDGNYIVAIGIDDGFVDKTQLIKFAGNGTILWNKYHEGAFAEDLQPTLDGGYLLAGFSDNMPVPQAMLYQLDANGDSVWHKTYPTINTQTIHSVTQAPDSGFVVAFELNGFVGPTPMLAKVDVSGTTVLWTTPQMGTTVGGLQGGNTAVIYDDNGYFVATGYTNKPHPSPASVMVDVAFVAKVDLSGNILMEQIFEDSTTNKGKVIRRTSDNGYILVGNYGTSLGAENQGYLVKMDSLINRPLHYIEGFIYEDVTINCLKDTNESGLDSWIVEFTKGTNSYYTTSNHLGYYEMLLDTGTWKVKATLPNGLWGFCVDSFVVTSGGINQRDTLDFAARALISCPMMRVDLSTPFLRRCSTNVYHVTYSNQGTVDESNAYIEVELDTSLYFIGASVPFTGPANNVYTFNVGAVPRGTAGAFTITTQVSCSSTLGAIHCAQAHIFPDTNCVQGHPLWDESNIDVEGICYGDTIEFMVRNIGIGDMSSQRQLFVTEDHVIFMTQPFQLTAGDSLLVVVATNGADYRLQAEQHPNHPFSTYSAFSIQMCVGLGFTTNSIGALAQYAEDDGSPAESIDCQPNIGSYDPNDKTASPLGYGANHQINQNIDLEYHIRFQNTGTDTAFEVVVYDTLSPYLNPSTVVPGASSHPYTWELKNDGVLVFRFQNILLPDSNVNEPLSHGYIKFRIAQDFLNPIGTVINNQAGIVFDMNVPVMTNTTFHTVDEDFIVSVHKVAKHPDLDIQVYPNPFQEEARIDVDGVLFDQLEVRVYDVMGRMVQAQTSSFESTIRIQRKGLTDGVYFFQLLGDGALIGTGKIQLSN